MAKRREDLEGSHDDKAKPVVDKPQDDLDDFLNMGAADKMDDYQALWLLYKTFSITKKYNIEI